MRREAACRRLRTPPLTGWRSRRSPLRASRRGSSRRSRCRPTQRVRNRPRVPSRPLTRLWTAMLPLLMVRPTAAPPLDTISMAPLSSHVTHITVSSDARWGTTSATAMRSQRLATQIWLFRMYGVDRERPCASLYQPSLVNYRCYPTCHRFAGGVTQTHPTLARVFRSTVIT
jgi:hypothetical protein